MDGPTFTVKFDLGRIVGIDQPDNHDQGSEGMSLSPLKPRFRNNAAACIVMPDDTAITASFDQESAQLDDNTGMLPLLTDVGMLFSRRFDQTGDIFDISKAISVENRLVACTPKGDPNLPGRLANLGISFYTRFECTGDVSDISASISARERAVDLTPKDGEDMISLLTGLGASYMSRFSLTQDRYDLFKAISIQENAVKLQSDEDEDLPYNLNALGESLMRRFEHEGNLHDISEAILSQERGVRLTPDDDEKLPGRLSNLGNSYLCRFQHSGVISDISEAILLQQKAVNLSSESHKDMPILLNGLGSSLMLRFEYTGNHLDIEVATAHLKKAARLAPEGHELAPAVLNNLGIALWGCFKCTGNSSDISDAISAHQKTLSLISASDKANCLNNLGVSFSRRFEEYGNLLDICEAISALQESISLTEEHHPKMPTRLNNLAAAFMGRFEQRGDLADMSNAISAQQRAVDLISEDHASKPILLDTLGSSLSGRFQKTKDLKDISESISNHERAVESTSKDHINLPLFLNNLGISFRFRYEQTGDLEDISKAISAQKRSIEITPKSHPYLPTWLNNLGRSLMVSYKATKDMKTISDAIAAQKTAIQHTPEGHGLMSDLFRCLADSYLSRFEQTEDHLDLETALSNYRQSADEISGPPSIRLDAAKQWATLAFKTNALESEVMTAFSTAIRLASQVAGLEQTIEMRYSQLILNISDLSTSAAAAALSFGRHETALEWLEQGRCLVWSQINSLRTPLDDLRDHDQLLADSFLEVSRALEKSGSRTELRISDNEDNIQNKMFLQNEVRKHVKLARRWEELLHEIRSTNGFCDFLQPPNVTSLLSRLPKTGPVVIINAHSTRCDAIALIPGAKAAIHIPLDKFSYTEASRLEGLLNQTRKGRSLEEEEVQLRRGVRVLSKRETLGKILFILWMHIVKPILNKLVISVWRFSISNKMFTIQCLFLNYSLLWQIYLAFGGAQLAHSLSYLSTLQEAMAVTRRTGNVFLILPSRPTHPRSAH